MNQHETLMLSLALLAAIVPLGLPVAAQLLLRQTRRRLGTSKMSVAGQLSINEPQASARPLIQAARRAFLTAAVAELCVVIFSFVANGWQHLAPAITAQQIVALDLFILVPPVLALGWDHNLSQPKAYIISRLELICWGALAGALAYFNYALFFVRHNLSAAYLDPDLPLYQQATALVFATLMLCLLVHLLFARAHRRKHFFTAYLWANRKLLTALCASLLLTLCAIYVPWLQSLLRTNSLSIGDWLCALGGAAVYGSTRLLQRHTRKHTRKAVITLHQKLRA